MRIAIIQFDNRPADQLGLMPFLVERNRDYARRRGYDHFFLTQPVFDLPVYWQKPGLLKRFLEGGYDYAAWLDTDAVAHDLDRRIEDLFVNGEAMVAAGDNPFWDAPFNAGVVFAKAATGGAALMGRWAELFAQANWTRTQSAWVCRDEWAGTSFEQGAFNAHLLAEARASGALRLADWSELQSPFPLAQSFTLHFAGPFKANLPAYVTGAI